MIRLLRGRYEPLEVIGQGGEGRVVRALDHQLDRHVALKIRLAPEGAAREELLREARVLLSLDPHPGLPLVREDFFEGGDYVIAMDWIDGVDLGKLLSERGTPGLAPTTVLRHLAQVAEALTHLHAHDPPVVHGDVKPANILLAKGGKIVLVDFGLAASGATRAAAKGTLGYVAPEVAAGYPPSPASDVYSLAMTAFALLTGTPPIGGKPEWPKELDADRARAFQRAISLGTATDPSRRLRSVGEFIELLRTGWEADLPSGVLTVVMTDIQGSATLWEECPHEMSAALVRHDGILAQFVESHGGRLIKSMGEGDSSVSVFTSALEGVQAAADVVRAIDREPWPGGLTVRVRGGVHTGEVELRDGDYFGPTMNRTARIRGQADGGQLFVSSVTSRLVEAHLPAGFGLVDLGSHLLRGAVEREHVYAVSAPSLSSPPSPEKPPYRGLLAFEPDDADLFFGREVMLTRVVERLSAKRFLAVVGASGSGKSSLVRAGLISAVRAGRIAGITAASLMVPGSDPRAALSAVPDSSAQLLVVDQFEEAFTRCDDVEARAEFFDRLLDRRSVVVVSLRADYYGHVAEHEGLARLVSADHVLLGAMRPDELRLAIEGPAKAVQLRLESGLADLVLRDATGEAGALPLLSHALMETWARRDGRTLTIDGYHAAGGVRGAIARTAEDVFGDSTELEQRLARQIFLRLTELGDGTEDSKRRARVAELVPDSRSGSEAGLLLEKLTQARLLTVDDGSVEVAHEALIREWPRLRSWLAEDRESLRLHRHLTRSASAWEDAGRDRGELYRGARLNAALEWCAEDADVTTLEREFLDASRAEQDRELREARAQARRARRLLAGVAVALVVAIGAGSLAIVSRGSARRSAVVAQSGRLAIQSHDVAAKHPDLGLLLALEALRLKPSIETRGALLGALEQAGRMAADLQGVGAPPDSTVFSPDGKLLATVGLDGTTLWDTATHRAVGPRLRSKQGGWQGLDFSPDGRTLAIVGQQGKIELWDVASRKEVREIPSPDGAWLQSVHYSPNGRVLVTGGRELNHVTLFDARTGRPLGKPIAPHEPGNGSATVAFSPDSKLIATHGEPGAITLWRVADQRLARAPIVVGDASLEGIAFMPDGRTLVVGDDSGTISRWDVKTGAHVGKDLVVAGDQIVSMGVSHDGRLLAAGTFSGAVLVWDAATGVPFGSRLSADSTPVWDVAFSPDGRLLASAADRSAALWDLSGRHAIGVPLGPAGDVSTAVAFRPGGKQFAVGRYQGSVGIFDASTREEVARIDTRTILFTLAYSPDGRILATGSPDGKVRLWDATTRAQLGEPLNAGNAWVDQVTFSPDGKLLAVVADPNGPRDVYNPDRQGEVQLWDVTARHQVGKTLIPGKFSVVSAAFSRDGRMLVTGNAETRAQLWRVSDQSPVGKPLDVSDDGAMGVAFSPDGRRFAAGGASTVRIWDVATRRPALPLLKGHDGFVTGVAYDPAGRFLATTAFDATRLWDPATGLGYGDQLDASPVPGSQQPQLEIVPPFLPIRNAFSADGRFLLTAGGDHRAMLWDLNLATWRARACEIAGRNLTREERRVYLPPGTPYRATCTQWPAA